MATIIQFRRDTAANWTANNPILADGEPALEKDTLKEKIGDGVTAWNDLPYKTIESSGTGSGVTKRYLTWTALLADQANQKDLGVYYVADASAHSEVNSGYAYFELLGTTAGTEADYRKLSEQESMDVDPTSGGTTAPVEKTGGSLVFTQRANYNKANPGDYNMIIDPTGAVKDVVLGIFVEAETEPTITGAKMVIKSGRFSARKPCIYWFLWLGDGYSLNIQTEARNLLQPPTLLVFNTAGNSVKLFWDAVPDATDYRLYASKTDSYSSASLVYNGSELQSEQTNVVDGETWYYWLKAYGAEVNGIRIKKELAVNSTNYLIISDTFNDSVIDPKWNAQQSADIQLTESDGKLNFTDLTTKTSGVVEASISSASYDTAAHPIVLRLDVTRSEQYHYFQIGFNDMAGNSIMIGDGNFGLYQSVYENGTSTHYKATDTISVNNSFKIKLENGNASFYYWYNGAWTLLSQKTFTNKALPINIRRFNTTKAGGITTIDNLFVTTYDFSTLNP